MNMAASRTHDVLSADSTNQQGVGDERTMTAPRHGFGAHRHNPLGLRNLEHSVEALLKIPAFACNPHNFETKHCGSPG